MSSRPNPRRTGALRKQSQRDDAERAFQILLEEFGYLSEEQEAPTR